MINYTIDSIILLLISSISTIVFVQEVYRYYRNKKKLRETNDMYITHTHILSNRGIIFGIISIHSLVIFILLNWYKWVIPLLKQAKVI